MGQWMVCHVRRRSPHFGFLPAASYISLMRGSTCWRTNSSPKTHFLGISYPPRVLRWRNGRVVFLPMTTTTRQPHPNWMVVIP